MFKNYPDIMSVKQVAEALGIGINNAYKLVNSHIIGSKRIRKRILVPKICLIDYVESSRFNSY